MRFIRLLIPAVLLMLAFPAFGAEPGGAPKVEVDMKTGEVTQEPPYHSPMRPTCEDELKKDADWQKILRDRLRDDVHQEDADAMLRNKAHVQYAYVAILVLMVGFLGFLYSKQIRLRTEITRLESELEDAKKK